MTHSSSVGNVTTKCLHKAFECFKAAARDGFVPAVRLMQNRLRDATDAAAIARANGQFIKLRNSIAPPDSARISRSSSGRSNANDDIDEAHKEKVGCVSIYIASRSLASLCYSYVSSRVSIKDFSLRLYSFSL
eukprot:5351074-Pyramimonas_sp.AAC.1